MERNLIAREMDDLAVLRENDQPKPQRAKAAKKVETIFTLKNRILESEGIANCTLTIASGLISGVTNNKGVLKLDMNDLPDNEYTVSIIPDYTYRGNKITELGNPSGRYPKRIYTKYETRIKKSGDHYASTDPNVSITGNNISISMKPIWMKIASSSTRGGRQPSLIVVHHTDDANQRVKEIKQNGHLIEARITGNYDPHFKSDIRSSIRAWTGSGTAPHYVIDRDGSIIKLGHETLIASHAGKSRWRGQRNLNSSTIGIEIVHTNNVKITPGTPTKPIKKPTYTEQFTSDQYASLITLLKTLTQEFNISAKNIFGHSDIGTNDLGRPGRKSTDPGKLFDWSILQAANLSLAPAVGPINTQAIYHGFFATNPSRRINSGADPDAIRELQNDLISIGYSCNANGIYDEYTQWAVSMLLQHYENVDGKDYVNSDSAILIKRLVMNL